MRAEVDEVLVQECVLSHSLWDLRQCRSMSEHHLTRLALAS